MDGLVTSGFGAAALDAVQKPGREHEADAGAAGRRLAATCFVAVGCCAERRRAFRKTRAPAFPER